MNLIRTVALVAPLVALSAPAPAEDQPPPKPDAPAERQFGDWVLRCLPAPAATSPKLCEIAETIRMAAKQPPVAEIALSRLNKGDPLQLTAHVPSNISLPSVVKFDYREAHGVTLNWRRCAPTGCIADAQLSDEQASIFHVQDEPGAINYYDANGNPVKLPVSFRGLGAAIDALDKP